jgi:hypothetical protein
MDPLPASCAASTANTTPKRRGRIVIRRKRRAGNSLASSVNSSGIACDLPANLPHMHEEVAVLRALLSREIDEILFDDR